MVFSLCDVGPSGRIHPGTEPGPNSRHRRREFATKDGNRAGGGAQTGSTPSSPRCGTSVDRCSDLTHRACFELGAVEDVVLAAAGDLEPSELHEQRDRLVDALA